MNWKVSWINLAPGAMRDERGYWRSIEGRFSISPNYRSTVNPDSYTLRDNQSKERERTFDTVGDCKRRADYVVTAEIGAELGK